MRTTTHHTSSNRSQSSINRADTSGRTRRLAARLLGAGAVAGVAVFLTASPAAAECDSASKLLGCQDSSPTTTAPPTSTPPPTTTPPPQEPAPKPAVVRDAPESDFVLLLQLMNKDRADANLPAFVRRSDIATVSQPHSRNMASKHTIWHNDSYFSSANRSRFNAKAMSENVAMNRSVAAAELAFMNSPGHKANLMDPRMTAVGLGVAIDERGMYYVTQNFIQPRTGTAVAPTTAPPSRPATAARPNTPRPAAARPASSPARTRVSAVATPAAAQVPVPAAAGVGFDPASAPKPATMRVSMRPTLPASNESTGLQMAIVWLGGLMFIGSTTPLVRLAVVRARRR